MNTRTGIALTLASMVMIVTACEERSNRNATPTPSSTTGTGATNPDRTDSTRTPSNPSTTAPTTGQPNSKLADDVRMAITGDTTLSQNAKNVEVTSDQSGVVTLRGQVMSQTEKTAIETRVKAVTGVTRVINELQVK